MRKRYLQRPELLTVPEAARLCGMSRNTVYLWVKQGKLPAYQTPGRTNLIRPVELVGFMEESGMFVPESLRELVRMEGAAGSPTAVAVPDEGRPGILVVDDDELVRHTMASLLAQKYRVQQAATGYEALHIMVQQDGADLVILDLHLPGLSGVDTLKELQKLGSKAKVLICTGYAEELSDEVREDPLVVGVLTKPLETQRLLDAVARAVAQDS